MWHTLPIVQQENIQNLCASIERLLNSEKKMVAVHVAPDKSAICGNSS